MSSKTQTEIDYLLSVQADPLTYSELKKIETVLMRILGDIRRFSGSEDVNNFIMKMQEVLSLIRQVQMTIRAFEIASGPLGWAYFGVSAVGTLLTLGDTLATA